jgi:membrane protease YdiL (CAAX protease family)
MYLIFSTWHSPSTIVAVVAVVVIVVAVVYFWRRSRSAA